MTGLAGFLLLSPLKQVRLVLQVASPVMKNDRKSDESIDNLIYILFIYYMTVTLMVTKKYVFPH